MPSFAYIARDSAGASVNGVLVADSVTQVSQMLRADGKYPVSVKPEAESRPAQAASAPAGIPVRGIRIARSEVIQLTTQLAIMIETGVTITEALDCIARQAEKPRVRQLVEDLARYVQDGGDFSGALSRHPRSFPRLFISLIKASEKSGMLSRLLLRATAYMRDEADTIRRVRGALIYPAIMLGFAITTTTFLLAFVLPRFTAIYAGKEAALPVPTKMLMALSDALVSHWMVILGTVVSTIVVGTFYFRTPGGSRVAHWLQLHTPVLGGMFRKVCLARGLRMLGTMGGAGVNLSDSVNMTRDMCGNSYYRDLWEEVSDQIHGGKQLSEPLFDHPHLVPRAVAQMLASGEKSGKLASVMEQVAGYSEQEMKEKIAEMTRYIEPAMIIVMGFIIGGVAMALLLPVFTISRVMGH